MLRHPTNYADERTRRNVERLRALYDHTVATAKGKGIRLRVSCLACDRPKQVVDLKTFRLGLPTVGWPISSSPASIASGKAASRMSAGRVGRNRRGGVARRGS